MLGTASSDAVCRAGLYILFQKQKVQDRESYMNRDVDTEAE